MIKPITLCITLGIYVGSANAQSPCPPNQTTTFDFLGTEQVYVGPPPQRYRICHQLGNPRKLDVNVDGRVFTVPVSSSPNFPPGCLDVTGSNIMLIAPDEGVGFYCAIPLSTG